MWITNKPTLISMKEKYEQIRQILAHNIKTRREILGLSQEKLAEAADLSVQTINTIEGCRMWVSDKTVTRLAKALQIEVFQLFVPYRAEKREINMSPVHVLLELRQKMMSDVDKISEYIDSRFNEAIKNQSQRQSAEETAVQKTFSPLPSSKKRQHR